MDEQIKIMLETISILFETFLEQAKGFYKPSNSLEFDLSFNIFRNEILDIINKHLNRIQLIFGLDYKEKTKNEV